MTSITTKALINLCRGDRHILGEQLQDWGLIPRGRYPCKFCHSDMKLTMDNSRVDGLRWYCTGYITKHKKRTRCTGHMELRTGTFFSGSKLSLFQILLFVRLWVYNLPLSYVCLELEISKAIAVDWASFCREVVLDFFIVHKEKLGGIGRTVEINESKFGKRKYHRGHLVEGQWVFSGYEQGTGRVFMVSVEDRSADTLIPVIQDWIEDGTTIISGFWKSYNCLSLQGYEHLKLNHSLNFKDPTPGAHANAMKKSLWRTAQSTISSSGRKKAHIPGNLARYIFLKRCGELKLDRLVEFFRLAGLLYNPLSPRECPRDQNLTKVDSLRNDDATDVSDTD